MMLKNILETIIDSIASETVKSLPEEILEFYKNLPGRKPSDHSKKISEIINQINEKDAVELMRDVVDRSVFSVLYLLETNFKEKNIITVFKNDKVMTEPKNLPLLEIYRKKIEPGGRETNLK